MTIRFDDAWEIARELSVHGFAGDRTLVAVRDLSGRITFVVDDSSLPTVAGDMEAWTQHVSVRLGSYAGSSPVTLASELFDQTAVLESPDLIAWAKGSGNRSAFGLERGVVGADWTRVSDRPSHKRVTMYGFKGGVGRTSATQMLAHHLAASGACVLVVDLDLESPGVGPLMQSEELLPSYGLVDHLVESVVHSAPELDLVCRSASPGAVDNGEVWVAPARGRSRAAYHYIPKLNRVYRDVALPGSRSTVPFADRLELAITACEVAVTSASRKPDVVFLDSRAGIHDIAAAAITRLSDLSLLFATDNSQTWSGYRDLFEQWQLTGQAHLIRERLQMVSALTPSLQSEAYLRRYTDHSQATFSDTLYDQVGTSILDAFNFQASDEDAPHYPIPVMFTSEMIGLDVAANPEWHASPIIQASYDSLFTFVDDFLESSGND